MKRVVFSADDFGLTVAVNEAVERAHRDGILDQASLMVAGAAADDAVRRARALPSLRVGLHLVVIEGPAVSPPSEIPGLVDASGQFPSDQARLGFRYFFSPSSPAATGAGKSARSSRRSRRRACTLDHANAHKHMHLHPTVGRLMIGIGREFGLRSVRVPAEPPATLAALGTRVGIGDRALFAWTRMLRHQARAAGMSTNDHCFGIAWSGHMTHERVSRLLDDLPDGVSEIYFHPATRRDEVLTRLMPDYEHEAELATLLDRRLLERIGDDSTNEGPGSR